MTSIDLILITFDALRRDAVGVYGGGPGRRLGLTPNLDKFSKEGVKFLNPYVNGPATEHSFISMFASQYSHETRTNYSEAPYVAELLSEEGYNTAAFHSNPVLLPHNNFHKGFDIYPGVANGPPLSENQIYSEASRLGGAVNMLKSNAFDLLESFVHRNEAIYSWVKGAQFTYSPPYSRAGQINKQCFEYLNHLDDFDDNPLFLWVHYMDTHDPYLPDANYLDLDFVPDVSAREAANLNTLLNIVSSKDFERNDLPEEIVAKLRSLYHAQVRRVDDAFSELIGRLKDEGRYEESLIIVGSDHGEQFLEHGWIRHSRHIYDELLKVPLLVKPPSGEQFEPSVSGLISYIDIAPTLLDYADIDVPSIMRGKSLRTAMANGQSERDTVYSERIFLEEGERAIAVRNKQWKLIVDESRETEELYNIDEDPGEEINLLEDAPEVYGELTDKLRKGMALEKWAPADAKTDPGKEKISSDVERRLKDLGYR